MSYHKEHCRQRCKERYGVELSNSMMKKIYRKIENGVANFLYNGADRRKAYGVSIDGVRFKVLYDTIDKQLITFLPNGTKND